MALAIALALSIGGIGGGTADAPPASSDSLLLTEAGDELLLDEAGDALLLSEVV